MEQRTAGGEVVPVARRIADCLVGPGFAVDGATTVLLLNSLITALGERHRIYLNGFHRSGEILNYFGHRLRRLGFDVHSLDPYSIIPGPQARDVMLSLSGSLRTEPVLVSLLHADLTGLYNFVITGQTTDEARKRFQGVLPVHIPGVTNEGRALEPELSSILPLGGLFELRAFLYLEAIAEVLGSIYAACPQPAPGAATGPGPDPHMMACLSRARSSAERVPQIMQGLVEQFHRCLDVVGDDELERLLAELTRVASDRSDVYVTGYGRVNEVGCMFAYRLANMKIHTAMTPSRLERPAKRGDLLLALSGSGYTYEVLQRMSGARRGGLRIAVLTAVRESSVAKNADVTVIVPAAIEPRHTDVAGRAQRLARPAPPSESTFTLNSLLLLDAVFAVLMAHTGTSEKDLVHPDPWQGFAPAG